MQSQSIRNNLIFSNIPESQAEEPGYVERTIHVFMEDKMKLAKEQVSSIGFERVHRMGPRLQGRPRAVVAKFTLYKERELVRRQSTALKGTPFYVNEQFPKEVADKRKRLYPKMKAARAEGRKAWISFDTLYVDGRVVKV